jgi:prepilin-type N-terminal cleavage/methylation domain-containing protein
MSSIADCRLMSADFPTLGKISSKLWKETHRFFQPLGNVSINRHSSTGNRQSQRGLTLVEVMLAIVILGIGAGTLMVATARCMAVATKTKHYSRAHRLILQVGTENPITRGELDDGTESGRFDDGYTWEREIIESEEEDREGLYTIRTRVSWSSRGRQSFEECVSYLYIPPEDDGVFPDRKTTRSTP